MLNEKNDSTLKNIISALRGKLEFLKNALREHNIFQ